MVSVQIGGDVRYFYPRSPCGERLLGGLWVLSIQIFLSTLSLRRATCSAGSGFCRSRYFYPRSPCGERPNTRSQPSKPRCLFLSTLSLRRATLQTSNHPHNTRFLSTLSLRRATQVKVLKVTALSISIHALLAESDNVKVRMICTNMHFYPRSPCGERRDVIAVMTDAQSISIHALLAESDKTHCQQD